MDLSFGPEYEDFRHEVVAFLNHNAAHAPKGNDLRGQAAKDWQKRLIENGYTCRTIPKEYGVYGAEPDIIKSRIIAEEFSRARVHPGLGGQGISMLVPTLLEMGTTEQKKKFIRPTIHGEMIWCQGYSEPGAGSDLASLSTSAVLDGDDWVINGGKLWISGADKAQYGLVFARTANDKGRNGVTSFIVDTDTPGFAVRRIVHTLRSAHYATELSFEDMRVPASNILGELNKGFAIANDRLTKQRIPYAAGCIGVAIKAQEMALEYVPQRETFGAPLSSRQSIQWMLVDNEIDIKQSLWITLEAAAKAERGENFRKEAAMAKLVATEAGGRVVDRCMQMFGGLGVAKDLPFERWFREMRIRRIGEGPSEVQRHVIARELLGSSLR